MVTNGSPIRPDAIQLRGVEVHNLKQIDLDLPHNRLIVVCGLSGSGKTSLAFDTLYAEGQRRYIETFSAYTRQFLEQLGKPQAERIDGIPAAVSVTSGMASRSLRSTVGTVTEISDYLRLIFAKIGIVQCRGCGATVLAESPQDVANFVAALQPGTKFMVAFRRELTSDDTLDQTLSALQELGFRRALYCGTMLSTDASPDANVAPDGSGHEFLYPIVDRLTATSTADDRLRDSLESAFKAGDGSCFLFVTAGDGDDALSGAEAHQIDGANWHRYGFSSQLRCENCDITYPPPEPRLFSFNSPLGACPVCEGFGNTVEVDPDLVVPDRTKSLAEGAIAPWTTPSYAHELEELKALAPDYDVPLDVPFEDLPPHALEIVQHGVPEREFGGLDGFFAWLERHKYKVPVRVFLSRWRRYRPCEACEGTRLRPESLCTRVGDKNIAEVANLEIRRALDFLENLELDDHRAQIARIPREQITSRLRFLTQVGLGYLTLDRAVKTLSGGESRRVALASALGTSLVNVLYVLDEPSIGLHSRDTDRLIEAVRSLRDRQNTVVLVEHDEAVIRAADHVVEIGPGAGERGGRVVFQGSPDELEACTESITGDYLAGRRGIPTPEKRRDKSRGAVRVTGARGNNLRRVDAEFPLGVLCVVTGVSGSGKTTLVQDTLYPALCGRLHKESDPPALHDDVFGDGQIDDCMLVDQSPIGRSPRSNPVTYIKAFDEIRAVFADTLEARTRNYTASHFSFNVDGGRCENCQGEGHIAIDMQFLADVYMRCPQCLARRYRQEILDVQYRGRNIADVLDMTVREAFGFFRGFTKVQARLKRLIDVGLDYVRLGQAANTLSGGESQRLKLATYLAAKRRGRCLIILDEPTTGLHASDVLKLIDCFDSLLAVGHSLIVVEHNLDIIRVADHVVDLGPGAAADGGRIIATGTPEEIAACDDSVTGQYLAAALQRHHPLTSAVE